MIFLFFIWHALILPLSLCARNRTRSRKYPSDPVAIPKFDVYTLESLHTSLPQATQKLTKPLIIDCFEFINEPITYFRLSYLMDYVDLFIFLEVQDRNSGGYQLHRENSALIKTLDANQRILRIKIDEFPYEFKYRQNTSKSDFFLFRMNQYHFRDTKLKHFGLLQLAKYKYLVDSFFHEFRRRFVNKPYILLFGKNNEIPRKEIVRNLPTLYAHPVLKMGLRLEMTTLYYSFKWMAPEERVRSTILLKDTGIQEISSLIDKLWYENERLPVIFRAGWRCSYCQPAKDIVHLISSSYPEYDTPDIANETWLNLCYQNGYDLFKRRYMFISAYDGSEGYPYCKNCRDTVPHFNALQILPES